MKSVADMLVDEPRNEIALRMSWEEYQSLPHLNATALKSGLKSMKHLREQWLTGLKDTDSMLWGRAVHCLLLEPAEFPHRYRRCDGRRTPKQKAAAAEDGVELMSGSDYDSVIAAANAWLSEHAAVGAVTGGEPECAVFATEGGVQCKGRIDCLHEGRLVDVKTTKSLDPRAFGKQFFALGYHIQLGLYKRWLDRVIGRDHTVDVVVVESSRPYDIAVIPIGPEVLAIGERKGLELIERVEQCIHEDHWPGVYGGEPGYLHIPEWEIDDELQGAEEVAA